MVYVDPLISCIPNAKWKWGKSCHMFADSIDELHAFAESMGLKRQWFQDGRFPHYDLTEPKRIQAVGFGAKELDRREAVMMWRERGWSKFKAKQE